MRSIAEIISGGTSFASQYSDPRWVALSNSVRAERGNCCECCKLGGRQTQVHHCYYDPALKLWEHPRDSLVLLCAPCHKELTVQLRNFRRYVFRLMTPQALQTINGALAVGLRQYGALTFAHAIADLAANPGMVKRFAAAWEGRGGGLEKA